MPHPPLPNIGPTAHPASVATVGAAVTSAAVAVLLSARYLAHLHLDGESTDPFALQARAKFLSALNDLIADVRARGPLAACDSFTPR